MAGCEWTNGKAAGQQWLKAQMVLCALYALSGFTSVYS